MAQETPYQILEVTETASQAEIKRAYRRLAKQFHPDSQTEAASHEQIARINTAYEVIGDPSRRTVYDLERQGMTVTSPETSAARRAQRTAAAQDLYRRQRQASQSSEAQIDAWLRLVYNPVDRLMGKIMTPLNTEIHKLAADPFDDELMAGFTEYLENCRTWLEQAQAKCRSMANPAIATGVTTSLFHGLAQLEDGLDELERFTFSYEESYIHTGRELFRISRQLRSEAKDRVKRL
ncbi:MAG: J domain-containing protein [Nodosilinea sp.]